jgi:hypothetical protein
MTAIEHSGSQKLHRHDADGIPVAEHVLRYACNGVKLYVYVPWSFLRPVVKQSFTMLNMFVHDKLHDEHEP